MNKFKVMLLSTLLLSTSVLAETDKEKMGFDNQGYQPDLYALIPTELRDVYGNEAEYERNITGKLKVSIITLKTEDDKDIKIQYRSNEVGNHLAAVNTYFSTTSKDDMILLSDFFTLTSHYKYYQRYDHDKDQSYLQICEHDDCTVLSDRNVWILRGILVKDFQS